ncbi:MAG: tRNA (adenine-N1)-methyltransferase [bacterium]|nr:tRNA (adenine-N1)-methyltransferase [bacterium]
MIKRILISAGRKFFYRGQDLHTQYGYIKKEQIEKAKDGDILESNTGKKFFVVTPSFIDVYRKIKRSPQIIPAKDIGSILTETGINNKSKVIDSGTGSGALACFLANIAKEVTTYELREDFAKVAQKNIELLGLKNIKIKNKDIYLGIDESNVDLICFDLPEPWKAIASAEKALKVGGFIVSYSPTTPQVADFVNEMNKNEKFMHIKTIEIMEREWEVNERKVRPKSASIGHSGFLTFFRRIS